MKAWTKAALQTAAMLALLCIALAHAVAGDTIIAVVVGLATSTIICTI